jgi:hypothetical protein
VILAEASSFAFSPSSAHGFRHDRTTGLHPARVGLSEIEAAILFLIPRVMVAAVGF